MEVESPNIDRVKYQFLLLVFVLFIGWNKVCDYLFQKTGEELEGVEFEIHGTTHPDWVSMRHEFREIYRHGNDEHSQLVIYHGQEKVVDLWGKSTSKNDKYTGDTISLIWSSGKSVASILIAMMVD